MKTFLYLVAVLFVSLTADAQNQFILSGTIKGAPENTMLKFEYFTNGKRLTDSARVVKESYILRGSISSATRVFLSSGKKFAQFYIDPGKMEMYASFEELEKLTLKGSKTNDENIALANNLNLVSADIKTIARKINAAEREFEDAKKQNKAEGVIDSLNDQLLAAKRERDPLVGKYEEAIYQYVVTHPASVISADQMVVYAGQWPIEKLKNIYNSFSNEVKNSGNGISIRNTIDERKKAPGSIAKDFSLTNLNGKALKLSDFKGKYVLIDFWGSWCAPCRGEMPHTIQTFKKYNKLGLEIIAIAAQDEKDNWIRAIKKDGTALWHNVLQIENTKGKPGNVTGLYNIQVFPTKILIDKAGNVVGYYESVGAEELDKKLAEIFKAG